MEGQATISSDILARYAADAACEIDGVRGVVDRHLPGRRGVRVTSDGDGVRLELHLEVAWGADIPAVGRAVQDRVRETMRRMANVEPAAVDVVVDEVGPL